MTAPIVPESPRRSAAERRTELLARRAATLGADAPLFYDTPLEFVRGEGAWLHDADGRRYLDGYNNVPHVGHAHPAIVEALSSQSALLNVHTRYLHEQVLSYAEHLLATFAPALDRIFFTNSGSEANELALRLARQHTGNQGVLISDHGYHGNTTALAVMTTGLQVAEEIGDHVRPIRIPDLDTTSQDATGQGEAEVLRVALSQVDEAIESLQEAGVGVSALLFDPVFASEGLPRLPEGYVEGLCQRVQAAGGLVISDEVQSGFGRTGAQMWGHQQWDIAPDLVTMGKPMGNGHPMGAVVTGEALLTEFRHRNHYFNTFAGNPVSAAVGQAVLQVMDEEQLRPRAGRLGHEIQARLHRLAASNARLGAVKGSGLFVGVSFVGPADPGQPDGATARAVVEAMVKAGVLINRTGRSGEVLKIRPPLAFNDEHVALLLDRLETVIAGLDA